MILELLGRFRGLQRRLLAYHSDMTTTRTTTTTTGTMRAADRTNVYRLHASLRATTLERKRMRMRLRKWLLSTGRERMRDESGQLSWWWSCCVSILVVEIEQRELGKKRRR